jgi:hypothetical protein
MFGEGAEVPLLPTTSTSPSRKLGLVQIPYFLGNITSKFSGYIREAAREIWELCVGQHTNQLSATGGIQASRLRPYRCLVSHECAVVFDQPRVLVDLVIQVRTTRRADELPIQYTPSAIIPHHSGNARKAPEGQYPARLLIVRDLMVFCTFDTRLCVRGRRICHQVCFLDICLPNVERAGFLDES